MNKFEMYNRVLSAVNEDEATFNAAAKNWVENADEANFESLEARELFEKAKICCSIWRKGAINGRISKRKMIAYVKEIAEMNLPNPYDPNEIVKEIVVKEEIKEEPKQEEVKAEEAKQEEPIHVLGVIPEETAAEEPKEEKGIFGRRKKK